MAPRLSQTADARVELSQDNQVASPELGKSNRDGGHNKMSISNDSHLGQLIKEQGPISSLEQVWELMKEQGSVSQLQHTWELIRDGREFLSRQLFLDMVMGFISDCRIEGSYLEFGSGHGGSLVSAFSAASRSPFLKKMQFYIFDSFEGLPEPMGFGGDDLRRYNKGDYACTLDQYKRNVSKGGSRPKPRHLDPRLV